MNVDTIARLYEALMQTIDEFSESNRLTIGDAMGALFTLMVDSAKASSEYDPKRLVEEVNARIREAVELH